jgi:hypothetical protein
MPTPMTRLSHRSFGLAEALGIDLYLGVASVLSAVQEKSPFLAEAAPAFPAFADLGPALRCPALLCASGQTPGSIWPILWQQSYEHRSTRAINQDKN